MPSAQFTWKFACAPSCSRYIEKAWNNRDPSTATIPMDASIAQVAAADERAWNDTIFVEACFMHSMRKVEPCAAIALQHRQPRHACRQCGEEQLLTIPIATAVAMHTRNLLTSLTSSARHMQIVRKILPLTPLGWWATYTLPGGQRWHTVSSIALPFFLYYRLLCDYALTTRFTNEITCAM